MDKPRTDLLKSSFKMYLEILLPVILHLFDVSIVEICIRLKIFYSVSHDFASVCFVLTVSLIFNQYHKKVDSKQKEFSLFQIGVVVSFLVAYLIKHLINYPSRYFSVYFYQICWFVSFGFHFNMLSSFQL